MKLRWGESSREVSVQGDTATVDGESLAVRVLRDRTEIVGLELAGSFVPVRVARQGASAWVWCAGRVYEFSNAAPRRVAAPELAGGLLAPMPGRVRRTLVSEGDKVARGQVVMILEAMKMEHAIRAPRDGVVTRIAHREGELVDAGVALAEVTTSPSS